MKPIKVRGLVLSEYEAGESDKRLMIFAKGQGRLMVYARGARKPTSKFLAAAQVFTYADFVLTQGRGFYALAQAQVIESFYPLRQDYDRLMAAHRITRVCQQNLWDNLESDTLLWLALKSLAVLAKGEVPPLQVTNVFAMRFFDVSGLRPEVEHCIVCNAPVTGEVPMAICPEGLVCGSHKPPLHRMLPPGAVLGLQHILGSSLSGAYGFTASQEVLEALDSAATFIWDSHFGDV